MTRFGDHAFLSLIDRKIRTRLKKTIWNPIIPLFLLLLTVYVFSAGGHLYSIDDVGTYSTTEAIVKTGSINIAYAIPLYHKLGFLQDLPDNASSYYSGTGLMQSVLAIPFYFVGSWLGVEQWKIVDLLYSPMLSAISGCFVYAIARRLRMSRKLSATIAILYGFATIAWPYAKFFFDVTTASTMQLAAVYFVLDPNEHRKSIFLSGLFVGFSVFARIAQVIVLPAMIGYVAFKHRVSIRRAIIRVGIFMIPLVLGTLLYEFLNIVKFGQPVTLASINASIMFHPALSNPLIGVYGMLLSSGEGLFIYYPLCAIGLFALLAYGKNQRSERFLFGWFFFINLLFYGRLVFWHGWVAWGARYLVPSVPYLILASAPFLQSMKTSIVRAAVGVYAISFGVFSNLMGVLINFNYATGYLAMIGAFNLSNGAPDMAYEPGIWVPGFSPLRASWDLIWSQEYPAEWYSRVPEIFYLKDRFDLFLYNTFGAPILLATLALVFLEAVWLVRTLK